jgi:hypothetical protein
MLWLEGSTESEARDAVQLTLRAAQNYREPFDRHVILIAKRCFDTPTSKQQLGTQTSVSLQLLTWSDLEKLAILNRHLLKSYVAPGVKIAPHHFQPVPPIEPTRRELPPHRPYGYKRPRSFDPPIARNPGSHEHFSFNTFVRFEHLVAAQYSKQSQVRLVTAKNHEPRGYAIGAVWSEECDPVNRIDLWLLTDRVEDAEKLAGLSPDAFVTSEALDFFLWVGCATYAKKESSVS